jgi:hypothetical protein
MDMRELRLSEFRPQQTGRHSTTNLGACQRQEIHSHRRAPLSLTPKPHPRSLRSHEGPLRPEPAVCLGPGWSRAPGPVALFGPCSDAPTVARAALPSVLARRSRELCLVRPRRRTTLVFHCARARRELVGHVPAVCTRRPARSLVGAGPRSHACRPGQDESALLAGRPAHGSKDQCRRVDRSNRCTESARTGPKCS